MSKPTIVLVHGAFGDASSWRAVFDLLDGGEHTLLAPAIPLRGVAATRPTSKRSSTSSRARRARRPFVRRLRDHGRRRLGQGRRARVRRRFAPDEGESITDLQGRFPSLAMGNFLQPRPLPDGSVELSVDPERFQNIFCADVPDDDAAFMAHAQRPLAATAFDEPAAAAAWRTKPSWAVFGTGDHPMAPELHRFSYDRAGSTVTEVEGASHFVMVSKPEVVAACHPRRRRWRAAAHMVA